MLSHVRPFIVGELDVPGTITLAYGQLSRLVEFCQGRIGSADNTFIVYMPYLEGIQVMLL